MSSQLYPTTLMKGALRLPDVPQPQQNQEAPTRRREIRPQPGARVGVNLTRLGGLTLAGILGASLLFTLLPTGNRAGAQTAATLQDVSLDLYPARDQDAVWTFTARQVTNDPVKGETTLTGLGTGERLLRDRGLDGAFSGEEHLDARLLAQGITIDSQDNMLMPQAKLQLVKECADIVLTGTRDKPVKIEQGYGFTAPKATVNSASMTADIEPLAMDYDFNILKDAAVHMRADLDAPEVCLNGQRVPARTP